MGVERPLGFRGNMQVANWLVAKASQNDRMVAVSNFETILYAKKTLDREHVSPSLTN